MYDTTRRHSTDQNFSIRAKRVLPGDRKGCCQRNIRRRMRVVNNVIHNRIYCMRSICCRHESTITRIIVVPMCPRSRTFVQSRYFLFYHNTLYLFIPNSVYYFSGYFFCNRLIIPVFVGYIVNQAIFLSNDSFVKTNPEQPTYLVFKFLVIDALSTRFKSHGPSLSLYC